jgi:hypothetical protein
MVGYACMNNLYREREVVTGEVSAWMDQNRVKSMMRKRYEK